MSASGSILADRQMRAVISVNTAGITGGMVMKDRDPVVSELRGNDRIRVRNPLRGLAGVA